MPNDTVKAWAENVTIPTYGIGRPDKNPMFLEKRVYQGSSGVVYPYPVIDHVEDEKHDRAYTALFLENRYLKIMILPELGGRVQMALDKTNSYHFIYYNRVIKPALVGLAGPWISGGIEFNWPQHHRPSTFSPVNWRIAENPDGNRTVWCSEMERMFNTQATHGFTLYPERAYLEIHVRLYNRTDQPQTFLWWANPAVHVNDDYRSVFPPDVHAVMDHGKRAVSDFPIATGTYYKFNYAPSAPPVPPSEVSEGSGRASAPPDEGLRRAGDRDAPAAPGTDISRYKNIRVPTSYMAYHSDFDFVGCYDEGRQAGMMHVANHHVVPGKKQWTWGNGDFGYAWDRELTDEDGPYIELMCGAYTDNQPDFSWIQPGEEKRFTQTCMPYKLIGAAKNASQDAVVNLELEDGKAHIGVYISQPRTVTVRLLHLSKTLFERTLALSPETALQETISLPSKNLQPTELTLQVLEGDRILIAFTPLPEDKSPIPAPATAARPPATITSNEELFLNGLHLEQYRHATYPPEPYYEEALRRDRLDSRCNNALGLLLYRRGKFAEAEPFFRKALERLTSRNPNPYDGEPFYNLGLSLKMQGRYREAFDALYKAVWSSAWQDAAYFELARLACRAGRLEEALDLTRRSLNKNAGHRQARHLRTAVLRHLGRKEEALRETDTALELEPMEFGALWERYLLNGDMDFERCARDDAQPSLEISLDYAPAGLWEESVNLLERAARPSWSGTRVPGINGDPGRAPSSDPLVKYYLGWCWSQAGDEARAIKEFKLAASMPPDYCFPNRLESVLALEAALRLNPADARAPYYLGNFWYAHRRYAEAIESWECARNLDEKFPTVHRNLGLAYYNKLHDPERSRQSYEKAFALNPADARVFYELDQLYKKLNHAPEERLKNLEAQAELVAQRDDLTVERLSLLNRLGRPEAALEVLTRRRFHPWEGGEGKVTGHYVTSLVEIAKKLIKQSERQRAIEYLERARTYPPNLGEGKLYGAQENHIFYYLGCAYEGLGETQPAQKYFEQASIGQSEPSSPMYYNDQPPDMIFYQGLARQKLGRSSEAQEVFQKLIAYGQSHLDDDVTMDYFAVSLPDFLVFDEDLNHRNQIHCHYMLALGHLGLGAYNDARTHFDQVLTWDINHLGAALHGQMVDG